MLKNKKCFPLLGILSILIAQGCSSEPETLEEVEPSVPDIVRIEREIPLIEYEASDADIIADECGPIGTRAYDKALDMFESTHEDAASAFLTTFESSFNSTFGDAYELLDNYLSLGDRDIEEMGKRLSNFIDIYYRALETSQVDAVNAYASVYQESYSDVAGDLGWEGKDGFLWMIGNDELSSDEDAITEGSDYDAYNAAIEQAFEDLSIYLAEATSSEEAFDDFPELKAAIDSRNIAEARAASRMSWDASLEAVAAYNSILLDSEIKEAVRAELEKIVANSLIQSC